MLSLIAVAVAVAALAATPVSALSAAPGDWILSCSLGCPDNLMTPGLPALWDLLVQAESGENVACKYQLREYPSVTLDCTHNRQTGKHVSGSSADVEKDFEAVLSGGQDVCPDDVNGIAYTRWSNCDEPPDLQNADPERFKVTYREVKCGIEPLPDMTLCGSTRYQTKTCSYLIDYQYEKNGNVVTNSIAYTCIYDSLRQLSGFQGSPQYPFACATSAPGNRLCPGIPDMPTPLYYATTGQRRKCLAFNSGLNDVCSYAGYGASLAGLACKSTVVDAAVGLVRDVLKVRHDQVVTNVELAELGFGIAASAFAILVVPEFAALAAACASLEFIKLGLDYCGLYAGDTKKDCALLPLRRSIAASRLARRSSNPCTDFLAEYKDLEYCKAGIQNVTCETKEGYMAKGFNDTAAADLVTACAKIVENRQVEEYYCGAYNAVALAEPLCGNDLIIPCADGTTTCKGYRPCPINSPEDLKNTSTPEPIGTGPETCDNCTSPDNGMGGMTGLGDDNVTAPEGGADGGTNVETKPSGAAAGLLWTSTASMAGAIILSLTLA